MACLSKQNLASIITMNYSEVFLSKTEDLLNADGLDSADEENIHSKMTFKTYPISFFLFRVLEL